MNIKNILIQWKKESGHKRPLQFKYTFSNKYLKIFLSCPGYLIGKGGYLFNKYEKILKEQNVDTIEFIETDYDTIY